MQASFRIGKKPDSSVSRVPGTVFCLVVPDQNDSGLIIAGPDLFERIQLTYCYIANEGEEARAHCGLQTLGRFFALPAYVHPCA